MGLLASPQVPCYLHQCIVIMLQHVLNKYLWSKTEQQRCFSPCRVKSRWKFCFVKSPSQIGRFSHTGEWYFSQIKGAWKPQLKSCYSTLKTRASHHGIQNRLVNWKAVSGKAERTMFQGQTVPGLICAVCVTMGKVTESSFHNP